MAYQTSEGTVCGSTCSQSQHGAPGCLPPLYWLPHMGSYTKAPLVPICLRNLGAHPIVIPTKVIIGKVAPANQVPPVALPMETSWMSACCFQKDWLLDELNLQGLEDWLEEKQMQARELLTRWGHLFAYSDLDMGKTSLIKHQIKLTEWTPFKECYWQITHHIYDDMKAHLQEMLDIGAIWKSGSPWASTVVLVQQKDGSLRFCIDLRKLKNQTIKDAFSLPHVNETLNSLQGSKWFSSLDLKSGYWQVEMDEESKSLTAFTVEPLGFYECDRMPFRTDQCLHHLSDRNLPQGSQLQFMWNLPG